MKQIYFIKCDFIVEHLFLPIQELKKQGKGGVKRGRDNSRKDKEKEESKKPRKNQQEGKKKHKNKKRVTKKKSPVTKADQSKIEPVLSTEVTEITVENKIERTESVLPTLVSPSTTSSDIRDTQPIQSQSSDELPFDNNEIDEISTVTPNPDEVPTFGDTNNVSSCTPI